MQENIIQITDNIIKETYTGTEDVIPALQAVQNRFNYLPKEALIHISENTEISLEKLYGVSTFYSQFRHKKAGKHTIKVCVGTACHVKGAIRVYEAFKRELKINESENTDSQGIFTVEKVACLGCCTIAPVVQIDKITYGHVSGDKINEIISDFQKNNDRRTDSDSDYIKENKKLQGEIRIGLGSCCVANGSEDVKNELNKALEKNKIEVNVKQVGCVGICNQVPLLEIHKPDEEPLYFTKIKAEDVETVVRKNFKSPNIFYDLKNNITGFIENNIIKGFKNSFNKYSSEKRDTPVSEFLEGQINIATEHRGFLKPDDIDEYIATGGFTAFKNCIKNLPKDKIIDKIKDSGLRGRGGGGFPTGNKWELVKNAQSDKKYVVCNGDEGDPGAFMDRMLLESYPHRIIEGMMIAAFTVGANEGIFYIRAEYPLAVKRIKEALKVCYDNKFLGENILESGFSFNIKVFEGAGAFICGEETALISSMEGNRGTPKMRPPYPAEKGFNNLPTLINNTETFSLIPWILRKGEASFNKIGTEKSKGTKVFALAGKILRGGLIEVPMGVTIKQVVMDIGGGIPNGKKFKAVQIGGPSGGCIPASMADTPIDFESLQEVGAMMGSGGLVVLDEDDCMVDIARYFLEFTQDQSCGKCTFCRIGTKRMLQILDKIAEGKAKEEDLNILEQLAYSTKQGSLCGLGKTAPNPVLSTLKYFRNEYEAHLIGKCPAGKCNTIIEYFIEDSCIGCTKCAQKCPTDAIKEKPYELHIVENEKCVKCDICRQVCPVDAVIVR